MTLDSNINQMVLASSSYFYLDHPNEPDPDDYGLEWATSGVDDMKIFNYTVRKDLNLSEGNPPDLLGTHELGLASPYPCFEVFPLCLNFGKRNVSARK